MRNLKLSFLHREVTAMKQSTNKKYEERQKYKAEKAKGHILLPDTVRFILSRNIVCGNALSLMCVDENQQDTGDPIVFSEWAFVTGYQLQRSDYTFARLMQGNDEARDLFGKKRRKKREEQMTLFDAAESAEKPSDEGEFLKKYVTHYRRVWENEQ